MDELNQDWMKLVARLKNLSTKDDGDKKLNIYIMVCYDIDTFRNFVFESSFLTKFDVSQAIVDKIKNDDGTEVQLDAFPCFICKKMVINAGLVRVICSLKDGGHKVFKVEDYVKEWKENDIIDDKYQYGKPTEWKEKE